jgi:hypothetical protein
LHIDRRDFLAKDCFRASNIHEQPNQGTAVAYLTFHKNRPMIRAMSRKFLATLLVCSWIILSGFDLLEDLRSPDQIIVTTASHGRSLPSMAGESGTLANNIIESAIRIQRVYTAFSSSSILVPAFDAILQFRTGFRLHKLYRVFLI